MCLDACQVCSCDGSNVDCKRRGLTAVPCNIPNNTITLFVDSFVDAEKISVPVFLSDCECAACCVICSCVLVCEKS